MTFLEKLGAYLFSKTRRGLLTLLLNRPGEAFYVNQIVNLLGSGSGAVQRELRLMTDAGIAVREKQGNLVFYRANQDSPVFKELRGIVKQTPPAIPLVHETRAAYAAHPTAVVVPLTAVLKNKLAAFCRRNHIRRLSLYGSVLRSDFRQDSDVDVLVEFEPDSTPGLLKLGELEAELTDLYGRRVDLRTPGDLSRYFRDRVMKEAEVQYASR